ncbi:hypothetical protein V6N13_026101 [Hibiscus sabdariffa]
MFIMLSGFDANSSNRIFEDAGTVSRTLGSDSSWNLTLNTICDGRRAARHGNSLSEHDEEPVADAGHVAKEDQCLHKTGRIGDVHCSNTSSTHR